MRRENMNLEVSDEEKEEIALLIWELSKFCDKKIPKIIEKKNLESLKKFGITIATVSLQFECDENTFKEIISRHKDGEGDNLTYFG